MLLEPRKIPKKSKGKEKKEEEEDEEYVPEEEEASKPKKKKKGKGKAPTLQVGRLPKPTEEDIAKWVEREKKTKPKNLEAESEDMKEVRLALEKLSPFKTTLFFIDPRLIGKPSAVIRARTMYSRHTRFLEANLTARAGQFPIKTIYVALGNVSVTSIPMCVCGL